MRKLAFGLMALFFCSLTSANQFIDLMKAEDQRRLCSPAAESSQTRMLREDVDFLMDTAVLPKDSVQLLVGECEGYASAAVTLRMLIVSPQLAELPRNERLWVLAHELGHIVNDDLSKWTAVGETILAAADMNAEASRLMPATSRELETTADRWTVAVLRKADIDPARAANAFFRRKGLLALPGTPSHPAARDRVVAMQAAAN